MRTEQIIPAQVQGLIDVINSQDLVLAEVYQAPNGYVQGSENGTPVNQLEKIYILVKQYKWQIDIANVTEDGTENLR